MKYLLDTNILLSYLNKTPYAEYIEETYNISSPNNITAISIITYAELFSFVIRRNWGEEKKRKLNELLHKLPIAYIDKSELAIKFAEIDAFCQNKHPLNPTRFSAIKLSDNDIWIAATASLSGSTLITADKDFLPLNNVFLQLLFVEQTH